VKLSYQTWNKLEMLFVEGTSIEVNLRMKSGSTDRFANRGAFEEAGGAGGERGWRIGGGHRMREWYSV